MGLLDDDDDMPDLNWPIPLETPGFALIIKPILKKYSEVKPEKEGDYFVCYDAQPSELFIDNYTQDIFNKEKMYWFGGDPVWWCEIIVPDGCKVNYGSYH